MSVKSDTFLALSPYFSIPGFRAAITLKSFPFKPPEDRQFLADALGLNRQELVIPKQVHSKNVEICNSGVRVEETDAVCSENTDCVLSIQVADCVPLFLVDKEKKNFGLVHAGWRGISAGILTNTVTKLIHLGSRMEHIIALIGPSIQQCCFEIGPEVAESFGDRFMINGTGERFFLDLQGVIRMQLENRNVHADHIHTLDECTCCQPEKYHSFRRSGKTAGRMIAICGWT